MSNIFDKLASLLSKPEKQAEVKNTVTVKELKEYKSRLYGSLSRDLSEFEKNFLFISAGTLAFSITFIKDIVKIDSAVYLNMLFLSWALIAVSIGIMMFTFIKSAYASDKLWFTVDDFQASKNLFIDTEIVSPEDFGDVKRQTSNIFKKSKTDLRRMRYAAITFFLFGLGFFGFFTGINTYKENHHPSTDKSSITIKLNTKSNQLTIEGVKFLVKDSLLLIEK